MKRYLILGATGLLGSRLVKEFSDGHGTHHKNSPIFTRNFHFLEGGDMESFNILLKKIKPHVVINCIGLANVDTCEILPEKSWQINCSLPVKFAEVCKNNSIKFIQISTDHYLSLGTKKLREVDTVWPANQYGFSKLSAEKLILLVNPNSLVVRTNFFHFNIKNPKTFLDKLVWGNSEQKIVNSFSDVIFTPVSTSYLSLCIQRLVDLNYSGVINVSCNEPMSKYEFHEAVLQLLKINSTFHTPIDVEKVGLATQRVKYMALDNSVLKSVTNNNPPSIYDMITQEFKLSI